MIAPSILLGGIWLAISINCHFPIWLIILVACLILGGNLYWVDYATHAVCSKCGRRTRPWIHHSTGFWDDKAQSPEGSVTLGECSECEKNKEV
jgi:hypothetical protein